MLHLRYSGTMSHFLLLTTSTTHGDDQITIALQCSVANALFFFLRANKSKDELSFHGLTSEDHRRN